MSFLFGLLFWGMSFTLLAQVVNPQPLYCDVDVKLAVQQPSCQGVDDGSIELKVNPVTNTVNVVWLNNLNPIDGVAKNLPPGLYQIVIVTPDCQDTIKIELRYQNPIIAPPLEKVFCDPGGTVNLLEGVSGGSGIYRITSITNATSNVDFECDNCPTEVEVTQTGGVIVVIEDSNGCRTRRSVYVKVLDPIKVERVEVKDDRCEGDGQIQLINITGGGGEYKFSINGAPAQTQDNFIQLVGNQEYKIQIIDQFGCVLERTVQMEENTYVIPEVQFSVQPPSCFGATDGELRVLTTGTDELLGFTLDTSTDGAPANDRFEGLGAGQYDVFARFGESCALKVPEEVMIDQPEELTLSALTEPASCSGNHDGEVLLLAAGGNANLTYRLNNSISPQATNLFTGLAAGEYVAIVEDEKSCQDSVAFSVENAAAPPINIDLTPTCPGDSSGIVIIESGKLFEGSLFYSLDSINWFRGDTITTTWPAGDFSIYILKVPGNCIYSVDTTMAEIAAPVLELNIQSVTCPGGANGSLSLTILGGNTADYMYSIDGENYGGETNFTGLSAAEYTVYVKDERSCVFAYDFSVEEPEAPTILPLSSDVSCFDGNDGEVLIQIQGGLAPFWYALDSPNFQTDSLFTSLSAGEHLVLVQDANLCHFVTNVFIYEPDPVMAFIEVIPETCRNANGVAAVQPFGGQAPYHYAWNMGDSSWLVGNLSAGMYTVSITDATGCSTTESAIVEDLTGPLVLGDLEHSNCYGEANGKIDLTVIGGSGELVYAWSNGSFTEDQDNLMAGSYIVTVVDQKLCATTKAFTLFEPDPLQLSYQSGQYNEFWFINLQVEGGIPPYQYDWSTGDRSEDVFDLSPGIYQVTVTDSHICQNELVIDLQPTATDEPDINHLLQVFPNPTADFLRIEWQGQFPVLMQLFDIGGRLIAQKKIIEQPPSLDLSFFPTGMYFLKWQAPEGLITQKILKQ
ncbi:MAG: T9SS type A sorting domain-containing protein [Saprospiraceae bacterium]